MHSVRWVALALAAGLAVAESPSVARAQRVQPRPIELGIDAAIAYEDLESVANVILDPCPTISRRVLPDGRGVARALLLVAAQPDRGRRVGRIVQRHAIRFGARDALS